MLLLLFFSVTLASEDHQTHAVREVLDNGLTVIVEQVDSAFVNCLVTVEVGKQDQGPNEHEMAHLVEHIVFEGPTQHGESQTFDAWAQHGNAYTTDDTTRFAYTLPVEAFDTAIFHLSERFGFPGDAKRDIARIIEGETGSVMAEAFGYEQEDDLLVHAIAQHVVFPPNHRLHRVQVEPSPDISHYTVDQVLGFRDAYYTPSNTTLTIVGGIAPEDALAKVRRWFDDWPAAEPTPHLSAAVQDVAIDRLGGGDPGLFVVPELQGGHVFSVWSLPPARHADSLAVRIGVKILKGHYDITVSGGIAIIDTPFDGVLAEQVELQHLWVDTHTPSPFWVRLRKGFLRGIVTGQLDSLESRAVLLTDCARVFDDPNCIATQVAAFDTLTADDVEAAVKRWLSPHRRHTLVAVPDASMAPGLTPSSFLEPGVPVTRVPRPPPEDVEGRQSPTPPPLKLFALPEAIALDLGEGRSGWLIPQQGTGVSVRIAVHKGQPMALRAMVKAFSGHEGMDTEISGNMNASRVVVFGEGEGIQAVRDTAWRVRKPKVPRESRQEKAPAWSLESIWRGLEPNEEPAQKRVKGLVADAHISVVVRGDLDPRAVEKALSSALGGLGGNEPITGPVDLPMLNASKTVCIDSPGQQWVTLQLFTGAPGFGEPDAKVMAVLDYAIGRQYHSRLKTDFRIGRQLSYYLKSVYIPWYRLWSFDIQVRPENVDEVLDGVNGHLDAVAKEGLTAEEVERAWIWQGLRWNRGIEDTAISLHQDRLWRTPSPPERVSTESTQRVAKQWLGGPRLWIINADRNTLTDPSEECWQP